MRLRARLLGGRLALQASAHRRGQLLAYVQRWRMRSKHKAGKQSNAHQPRRWTKTNKREQRRARTGEQRAVAPGQVVRPLLVARLQVDLRAAASNNPQGKPLSKSDLSGDTPSCFCTFAPSQPDSPAQRGAVDFPRHDTCFEGASRRPLPAKRRPVPPRLTAAAQDHQQER